MTTPTTMTTSTITTATTMMTDVVVAPSLGGLLVGCMLLLTEAVPVVVVAPTVWGGEVVPTVWGGEVVPTVWEGVVPLEIDAVGMKYTGGIAFQMDGNTTHITLKREIYNHIFNFALQWGEMVCSGIDAVERKHIR